MTRRPFLFFPALALSQSRPKLPYGVMSGDVLADRAIVWARSDRPEQLVVEWSTTEQMTGLRTVKGGAATDATGLTARVDLTGLPPGQTIFYRARFGDGEPVAGRFRTAPRDRRDVRFLWSGDTCGQGYGINPDLGGMVSYEGMRRTDPDFFIHSGDNIYADGPIPREQKTPDGLVWRNVVTEAKSKVAETVEEFRGAYLYNMMDENVRRFNASVAQVWQWDDHEVINNWSPGKDLVSDARYKVKDIGTLVAHARQAFLEHAPMRITSNRIYRRIPYGPLLDVFVLDMRTYRAANGYNRQAAASGETAFMGTPQIQWLKRDLARSKALWKVIAADMPLGLLVPDGKDSQGRAMFEAVANGDGPVLGREFEIADLLTSMKKQRVRNVVWLTADVHYTAAHIYRPEKAQFTDFDPFWEFVSGPLNAGTFGPAQLDNTFGPEVKFQKFPTAPNSSPASGQYFGEVFIEGKTGAMTVALRNQKRETLFKQEIPTS
ncbi:MAG: alkaline phosphatase D family protein [Bryobacteraceae bacterium]